MTGSRTIALVSPLAWPPSDEVTWRIAAEAAALAARGNRVSILTPARGTDLLSQGRRILADVRSGDADAVLAAPGAVRVVPLGRAALPTGAHRRIGGPIDLSVALEDILSRVPFDVVHVHEPLSPTPVLRALRNARGVTAATLHRIEPVTGVAFLRPIVERAMDRVDVWVAATEPARRAVAEHFDRDAIIIPPGVDTGLFSPVSEPLSPPPLVIMARGQDREGVRFGLSVLRAAADTEGIGPITLLTNPHAPRRTAVAIPKALRADIRVVPDTGPASRAEVFGHGGVALFTTEDDVAGSAVVEAMAAGMAVMAPRSAEVDTVLSHGVSGFALAPFSRDEWAATLDELVASDERRLTVADAAATRAVDQGWDRVAAILEAAYDEAARALPQIRSSRTRIIADLRVHPSSTLPPRELVAACAARGVGAVAVICEGDVADALEAARLAPDGLRVVVGQQVRTAEGDVVGLFIRRTLPEGMGLVETVVEIEAQGGLVMIPHPVWGVGPPPHRIRELGERVACGEALSGPASVMRSTMGIEDARLMQTFGLRVAAGSGATQPQQIGAAHLRMAPFDDAPSFLRALDEAEAVQQRRGLRPTTGRERRRMGTTAT